MEFLCASNYVYEFRNIQGDWVRMKIAFMYICTVFTYII